MMHGNVHCTTLRAQPNSDVSSAQTSVYEDAGRRLSTESIDARHAAHPPQIGHFIGMPKPDDRAPRLGHLSSPMRISAKQTATPKAAHLSPANPYRGPGWRFLPIALSLPPNLSISAARILPSLARMVP